ncbi:MULTISPECIES: MarR family winged helix-turn-helix transcriptional regulator [unclassified Streptomyces]|uniref:MarR family winged helix-turn-helix transcriptional regulator n=1 Tax=unclassified Streptomyces TaxID=2593676 RepID=UPI0013B91996|nr:MarR family transcriptional regulator [Streptomyces sp. SID14446]NEB31260.1 MarR family transcriptional regulator [Streptomyces sp. SID14446]
MPVGHTREPAREPEAVEQGGAAEQGDTVDALVQLSFLVQGVLARMASEHDLSLIQVRLLGILRDRRPGMLELARLLGLDKSSMTGLVSRAEKRGLVRRIPSPDDGRAVLVELTDAGRELTGRCTAEMGREIAGLTASLTTGERAQVTALAGKILGNAQENGAG